MTDQTEEYSNALTAFNIATDRLRVAIDQMWKENKVMREQLEKEYTLEEIKDKYFPNQEWDACKEDFDFTLEWLKDDTG